MKRLFVICISAALVSLAGCSDDEDVQPAQKERIVSFLTGTHAPRLVAEENLEEGSNQPYYTVSGDAVYRYITDIYNPDRVNWPEVTPASTVKITFRAYVFTYANIVTTGSENNWHPDIIKGLADALLGCREGDAVEVYMTYNMAYGDDYFGLIPNESPIAWFFTVDAVDPVDADAPVEPAN